MWCWRRMEKISWTDHMRNEEVLLRVEEQRNILLEISKRKANWIGHILCRNCLLQRVIAGKIKGGIEVTGRRGRRRRKLLDDLTDRRGYSHLKEEALDRTMWRACFGRGFGPVIKQTTKWMNITLYSQDSVWHYSGSRLWAGYLRNCGSLSGRGDISPVQTVHINSGAHPASCSAFAIGSFPKGEVSEVLKWTINPHLVAQLRMSGVLPPLYTLSWCTEGQLRVIS